MKRRMIGWMLIAGTRLLWVVVGFLVVRQGLIRAEADPMSDTGVSFGSVFLIGWVVPGMVLLTGVVMVFLVWLRRGGGVYAEKLKS